jgi:hypothetical protein
LQRREKLGARLFYLFRSWRIDHNDDLLLRKVLAELRSALHPWEILRNRIVDIGLQRKVLHSVCGRAGSEDQSYHKDPQRTRCAERYERNDTGF